MVNHMQNLGWDFVPGNSDLAAGAATTSLRKEPFVSGANSKSSRFIQENGFDRIAVVREFPSTPAMEGTQRDDPESHGCGLSNALIAVGDYDLGYEVFFSGVPATHAAHMAQLNRRCQCNNWRNTTMTSSYPKRLIEVDLPIRRISEHARREKSIRHGHISTLHIWWARRPLATCRAVICAALWPDPADNGCPAAFRVVAAERMYRWAREYIQHHSVESHPGYVIVRQHTSAWALAQHPSALRKALLDFIADFANWDNSTVPEFLETARTLTAAAHYGLSLPSEEQGYSFEWPGEDRWKSTLQTLQANTKNAPRPLVVDPFAGGGSIPLEALRAGADAFASDLNPVAVLLNKVVLEYIPKYGQRLADEVRKWGEWIKREAEKKLAEFYPNDADGATPIAYLWARTIQCEGPGCGAEVPILLRPTLSDKPGREAAVSISYKERVLRTEVVLGKEAKELRTGTNRRSSVTCPACGYTTPRKNVERQSNRKGFGYHLLAVCTRREGKTRYYRQPSALDVEVLDHARQCLSRLQSVSIDGIPIIPTEELPYLRSIFNVRVYGIDQWHKLFTSRQLLSAALLTQIVRKCAQQISRDVGDKQLSTAIIECLSLSVSNSLQYQCNITTYPTERAGFISAFIQGQSLPMKMDFVEVNPLLEGLAGGLAFTFEQHLAGLEYASSCKLHQGTAANVSALTQALPDDSCDYLVTDPPYYDAIPYADCSDFFYVWLRRMLIGLSDFKTDTELVSKPDEIVQLAERNERYKAKTKDWFENRMKDALENSRRAVRPNGLGVVLFAHKDTAAWEAMLQSVLRAGWVVTSSWPIDTENANRMRASESAVLSSTVHITCRPRENPDGSVRTEEIGDWRDVLQELPRRIHEWMPRLAEEGVVGADAIFACLGPALEIFSRYSRVEKASGEAVPLREYLEQVWAAVSREALSVIFEGASTEGFEADARLTAMWLWTLSAGAQNGSGDGESEDGGDDEEDESKGGKSKGGFALEFDAARKIAQGLGAHLEDLRHVVEIAGETARLLPVTERTAYLFAKDEAEAPAKRGKKKSSQLDLFTELAQEGVNEAAGAEKTVAKIGETTLDRIHQSMILFAAGRSEALKRFLVDDAAGRDTKFWRLAQTLSALYPPRSNEKRWVDGVLAKKKGLGL